MSCLKYKASLLLCLGLWAGELTYAQSNGTNSSYSRFGLGIPADQSQGYNRSMGGVAQGLRSSFRINKQNPASYAALDSLTFIFDVGMSVQRTFMKQESTKLTINNSSFDYVTAAFRLRKNLGMSIGFLPYTRIGYNFYTDQFVARAPETNDAITKHQVFKSADATGMQTTGGLHQAYAGIGWMPYKGFSIGVNAGVMWGNINHTMQQTTLQNGSTTTTDTNIRELDLSSLLTWTGEIGAQYQTVLNPTNRMTFGATIGLGHTLGRESTHIETSDTTTTSKGYQIPMTYSVGLAWEHAERLTLAADFTYEAWGNCTTPQYNDLTKVYAPATGAYQDRFRVNVGAEYVPGRYDRKYSNRINYRVGAYYSSPYLKINGKDGPKEFGLTAGIGIPLTNTITHMTLLNIYTPSYINIGVQWTHRAAGASAFIKENIIQLNVGVTFNERWFMKWKFK